MVTNRQDVVGDEIVSKFARHLVPIRFLFVKGTESYYRVYTAFVISVKGYWFLITAGHCIQEINRILSNGYEIRECSLIDTIRFDAEHKFPIPFDYEGANPFEIYDEDEFDFGFIFLRQYYVNLLKANNVIPFDETTWKHQPENPELFCLLGVPGEMTSTLDGGTYITQVMAWCEKIEKPDFLPNTESLMFYAKISIDNELDSIEGMSGGPIIAFQADDKGNARYWLYAVQSGWVKSEKIITALLTTPIVIVLEGKIK